MNDDIYSIKDLTRKLDGYDTRIPDLQRNYVWREKEWERLWNDIVDVYSEVYLKKDGDKNAQLFLGVCSFCVKEGKNPEKENCKRILDIIDGQQRLTTLIVLHDMLSNEIPKEENEKNEFIKIDEGLHVNKAGEISEIENKINTANNDDVYCMTYNFFAKHCWALETEVNDDKLCKRLADIVDHRVFLFVKVDNEQDEHSAFETLNATGIPLSYQDLILNHLVNMAKTEGCTQIDVKGKWLAVLEMISKEELPSQTDSDDESNSDLDMKPLKIKKFFNALHSLTLPKREAFPEGVDSFIDMLERMNKSFYPNETFGIEFILNRLEEWAGYYIEYIHPQKKKAYSLSLYYLKTIGTTALIPAVMRTLFWFKKGKLSEDDVENIFHALVTAQLLRAIYSERENSSDNNSKLQVADYLYIAIKENNKGFKPYEVVLHTLADDSSYFDDLNKDAYLLCNYPNGEDNDWKKLDDIRIWNMPYHSGYSKVMLAIGYDKDIMELEEESKDGPFQVEHMVALMVQDTYQAFGYDSRKVDSLWNLNLLEEILNIEASDKKPEDKSEIWKKSKYKDKYPNLHDENMRKEQIDRLTACTKHWFKYFGIRTYENYLSNYNAPEYYVVTYVRNGLGYTKAFRDGDKRSGKQQDGSVYYKISIDKDNKLNTEPAMKGENNAIIEYFLEGEKLDGLKKAEAIACFFERCKEALGQVKPSSDFLKDNSLFQEKDKYGSRKLNTSVELEMADGSKNTYYINVINNSDAPTDGCRKLYEAINTIKPIMVPFWFQMSKPEMHYISGKHVLTHYRNIGDRDAYEEFILQENNGLINKERISQVKTAADGGPGIIPLGNSQHYIKREEYPSENRTWNGYEYCIPEYQRSYVWEEKQFRAFEESLKKNRNLGTIILYKRDEKTYEIVDGQQRLTTLGSMYKAIGASAPFPGVSNDRAVDYFKEKKEIEDAVAHARFAILIIDETAGELYQYKVFGTVNGCGKRLTVDEKIRNYLFSIGGKKEQIDKIVKLQGFVKAYAEMKKKEHVSEIELYDEFKEIVKTANDIGEVMKFADDYQLLKESPLNKKLGNYPELCLWIMMYRELGINTADALLMHVFSICKISDGDHAEKVTAFMRKLIMLYFLLYVDDPNGNGKKSINGKLPKLIANDKIESITEALIQNTREGKYILDGQLSKYLTGQNSAELKEFLFEKLKSFDLARDTRKEVARYILLLCELWCGMGVEDVLVVFDGTKPPEIEHIFPANPDKNMVTGDRPAFLYCLENLGLLDAKSNKIASNNKLGDKGKIYKQSQFKLIKIETLEGDHFGKEQAENRIESIKNEIFNNGTKTICFSIMAEEFLIKKPFG